MSTKRTQGFQCRPVEGVEFEDTIDGYFPLIESIRQLLKRQDFVSALISLSHAPFLQLDDLDLNAPVPLKLHPDAKHGQIKSMLLQATLFDDGLCLSGVGDWSWSGVGVVNDSIFSTTYRLAEPVHVAGLGLVAGPVCMGCFGRVKTDNARSHINWVTVDDRSCVDPSFQLGTQARLWGLEHSENAILKSSSSHLCVGQVITGGGDTLLEKLKPGSEYLLVDDSQL